jgi:hypothetical protein
VDDEDFVVDDQGILHLSPKAGSAQLLTYTTAGSFTFNPNSYPGLKAIRVRCLGGGGGGAGADAASGECIVRAGASGGGYSESVFTVGDLPSGTLNVVVGNYGAGATGNNPGADGGTSSFGGDLVVALGGVGSRADQASGTGAGAVTGTGGPLAGTGQIRLGGGPGLGAIRLDFNSGLSGAGGYGGGGFGSPGGARASEGDPYGERGFGGGGAGAFSNGASQRGGDGSRGAVFIDLYF